MPGSNGSNGRKAGIPREGSSDRRRMLQPAEQHPQRDGAAGEESPTTIPVELLVAFTRRLVQNTVTGDALYLSLLAAQSDVGASKEDVARMWDVVNKEHARNSVWPKGF